MAGATSEEIEQAYVGSGAERLLADQAESCFWHFSTALNGAVEAATADGCAIAADVLRLLSVVCRVELRVTGPETPFEPLVFSEDRRIDPVELSDDEIRTLEVVSGLTAEPLLKARLRDVLWFARRRFPHCQDAIQAYFEAGDGGRGSFVHRVRSYRRAVGLARSLGVKHAIFRDARERLVARTQAISTTETASFYFCQMLGIVADFCNVAQIRPLIPIALQFAQARFQSREFYGAEHYWQMAATLQRRAGDEAGANITDQLIGECHVENAEHLAGQTPTNYMGAVHWMSRGIEQLQRSSVAGQRLTQLRIRLQELQRRSLGELHPIVLPEDLVADVEAEQQHNRQAVTNAVTGGSLSDALIRLATGLPLASFADVRQQLIDGAQVGLMQALFPRSNLDSRGRVRSVAGGMMGDAKEAEEALRQRAYSHLAQHVWRPRADLIATACGTIWSEHIPFVQDLVFLAHQSPWIVQGHEEIVLRGLHAGLYGDWLMSGHLLFAQFEASLRAVMERLGISFAVLEGGVEEDRTLGALLKHERCAEIIGADLQFELQALLIEKNGANFRNDAAHGLLPDRAYFSAVSVVLWWLMLRLCCSPVPGLTEADAGTDQSAAD